jgi:hypothetical protein
MITFTRQNYINAVNAAGAEFVKFHSAKNVADVLNLMQGSGWIPSAVSVMRAVRQLGLVRTDRKDARADAAEAQRKVETERQKLEAQNSARPLSPQELELFASMETTLAKNYWGDSYFQSRYSKACREFGYRLPGRAAAPDTGEILQLDAIAYRSIPANVVAKRPHERRHRQRTRWSLSQIQLFP